MMYDLKLPQQAVLLVLQALADLPLKTSLNAFTSIQEQVAKQDRDSALELKDAP